MLQLIMSNKFVGFAVAGIQAPFEAHCLGILRQWFDVLGLENIKNMCCMGLALSFAIFSMPSVQSMLHRGFYLQSVAPCGSTERSSGIVNSTK